MKVLRNPARQASHGLATEQEHAMSSELQVVDIGKAVIKRALITTQ